MKICSWKTRVCGARSVTLAGLIVAIALPLGALNAAHAQRHGPPHMQRGPAAAKPHVMGPQRGAQSHASLRSEFRTALEPHGHWQHHARWGDVWLPANRPRNWRPYTVGRWVYTNDWGWYWVADDVEANWGLVTYHYGRWVYEDDFGWCWVPGEEWSPGWVQWRRPTADVAYVGWAPLPPDEVIVEYVDQPRFWIFVHGRDFIAPRLASVILPLADYDVFFRNTVVVNRTLLINDRYRFAVNPGISPTFIAAATRQPLRTYNVRPIVLAGTGPIQGATEVRAQDLRNRDFRPRIAMQPTQNVVRPAARVQPAQPLAAGERGRLGDQPPRGAQRGPQFPSTTGQAPAVQQQVPTQQQQGQRELPRQQLQRQKQPPQQRQPQQDQQRAVQPPRPTTEGRSAAEQRQQTPGERRMTVPQQRQQPGRSHGAVTERPGAAEQQRALRERQTVTPQQRQPVDRPQRPAPEGRRAAEPRQSLPTERRAVSPPQQRGAPQVERRGPAARQEPVTEGRSAGGGAPHAAPAPRMQGGATEGRGGGPAAQHAPGGGGPSGPRAGHGPGGRH